MQVSALMVARLLVVVALFPVLAGCATSEGEPLQRGDLLSGLVETAAATPGWASEELAIVRPGIMIQTEARDCLANFLFVRPDNGAVFIGTTAYCVRDMVIGEPAIIGDATDIAVLAYSSALTMVNIGESDPDALEYNDFALFYLRDTTAHKANPALPLVGGPSALAAGDAHGVGDRLRAFARDAGLPRETDWRDGVVAGRAGDWALLTYSALPVAPGTTGGTVIDDDGAGVGIVVTLGVTPHPGANGVARLDTLLAYAAKHGAIPLQLATSS